MEEIVNIKKFLKGALLVENDAQFFNQMFCF